MEFFSDFNYDDLQEINMSGGGNSTNADSNVNIEMSEELKKGQEMEEQNADKLTGELNRDPSENTDRETELKFDPELAEKLNNADQGKVDLNELPGEDLREVSMAPRTPPEQAQAPEVSMAPRTPPEQAQAPEVPMAPRTPPEPEPEVAMGSITPPEPEPEVAMGSITLPEPEEEEEIAFEPRTQPEPEEEPEEEPERSKVEVEQGDPEQQQKEPTVSEPPDADSKELDFLKLLQKNTMKKEGLLVSEIEDITKGEDGVYHTVNKLLARLESDKYAEYREKLNYMYESQIKHAKDYTFTNKKDTFTQKTNPKSKRNNELVTITKPQYQDTPELLKYLDNELSEVEFNLKQANMEALDENKKKKNLGDINKLKDEYFKLSEKIKLVTQYHESVNNTVDNTNRVNNNLLQIGKNSAEKRLLFSEINQIINSDPMDQEKLDEKIKEYISLGDESTRLREKVDEIRETPQINYMIVKEPSVAVRKLKASETKEEKSTEEKPKKNKIKVKSKAKGKDKSKNKMKGGGDKNKSLETVIETIDLLNHESSSESEGEADAEPEVDAEVESKVEVEAEQTKEDTKKIFITNDTESDASTETKDEPKSGDFESESMFLDDDLEEIDLTGGAKKDTLKIDALDLSDDLSELADYNGDSSDESDTEQQADFSSTYASDSNDTLDTAESIPLDLTENINGNQSQQEEQTVNVIKLGQ